MAAIRRTRQANEDLIAIWSYIANEKQSPLSADRLLRELDEAIQLLAGNPLLGQTVDQYRVGLRMFTKRSYIIFYQQITGGIEVFRVLHGARMWQDLLKSKPPS